MTRYHQKILERAHDNLLGAIIRDWQKKLNITNWKAAQTLGTPLRTYNDWKAGKHSPRGFALEKLYDALKLEKRTARRSNADIRHGG